MRHARVLLFVLWAAAALVTGCQSPSGARNGSRRWKSQHQWLRHRRPQNLRCEHHRRHQRPRRRRPLPRQRQCRSRVQQQRLTDFGYKPGPVNGKPGQWTTNALKHSNNAHRLPPTGMLDEETIRALEKM